MTYVTVEEDDDDDWVVFAAAAGYTGMMVAWGCAVWGSGWYYPPYYGYGGYYPYYYRHFPTYGYSAWYNPWTGAYGRSAGVYGPYGGAGVGARYNPRTGTYARGAAAYGPYGARGVAQAYNPRTGTYAATRQGSNVYGSWGSTAVQRGDDWAKTNRYTNRPDRHHDAHDQDRRGRRGDATRRPTAAASRSATAATSTPGRTATSIGAGRHVAEVRQRRLVEHRPTAERRSHGRRPTGRPPADAADRQMDRGTRESAQSRFRRAPRGRAANRRYGNYRSGSGTPRHRQLPWRRGWRWRSARWRWRKALDETNGSTVRRTCDGRAILWR